jgi:SAM-dependent methyltransferase
MLRTLKLRTRNALLLLFTKLGAYEMLLRERESLRSELSRLQEERNALYAQLVGVGKERDDLRELGNKAGLIEVERLAWEYFATRYRWQNRAICAEHFGPAEPQSKPVAEMPAELRDAYTLGGRIPVEPVYMDETYPGNWPLVYRDEEIDHYIAQMREGRTFIYGMVDEWVQEAFRRYPVKGLDVVTMGSRAPWYEAMIIAHGGRAATIDYNRIICRTSRVKSWTTAEWDANPAPFDYALSISSFEHDGLGAYGDPLDPEGDLKAMKKMKQVVKPGGILLFAVPTGADKILFNQARVYGRIRMPMMLEGWKMIDSVGFTDDLLDSNGHHQPVLVLRNV